MYKNEHFYIPFFVHSYSIINIKEINYYNDGYYRIQLLIDLYDKKDDENYHIT